MSGLASVPPGPAGDWDPGLYSKFENERTLAARDLLRRVPLGSARVVVDLGCGPGNSAELLVQPVRRGESHRPRHVGGDARGRAGARSGGALRQGGHR